MHKCILLFLLTFACQAFAGSPEHRVFAIQKGDVCALAIRADYLERGPAYALEVTLTRRRTLEWLLASLDNSTPDPAQPGTATRNFELDVELAEGWSIDGIVSQETPSARTDLYTFRVPCVSFAEASARLKLLEPKCVGR